MRKKTKGFFAKVMSALTIFATIISAGGGVLSFPSIAYATAAVSNVVGIDSDTTGPGLDGRDFAVSWTPGTQPAGYTATKIFVLPNATAATASSITTTACGGGACQDRGFLPQFQANQFMLPQFFTTDSAGTPWNAATPYKACVYTQATANELACSNSFSVTSDVVTDSSNPFIDHMPVHAATGGQNAVINAFVFDDQTSATGFASGGASGIFSLSYGSNLAVTESTVNGVQLSGELFQFTVPASAVPAAGGQFQYYLKAQDAAGNATFFCANQSALTAGDCKTAPFVVKTVAAGSRTVSGTIFSLSSGTTAPLEAARVFAGGYALASVTSAANGVYTLSGLPNNDAFEFTASKAGYTKAKRFETIGSSNLSAINLNLNLGEAMFAGPMIGGAGPNAGGSPHVMFSGPPDGAFGISISDKIRVGFDQALSASTVNDVDASNAGSPVYLTTDDGTTKIAGSTLYCANNAAAGCSSLFPMDANTILFTPASNLAKNTFYTLVVTEAVTSPTGQTVDGNRPGGGHRVSFTTGGDVFTANQVTASFGSSGQYMPPFVRSMIPGPGIKAAPNTKLLLEFDGRMNTGTLTSTNLQLWNMTTGTQVTLSGSNISVDSNEQRFVTISPTSALAAGDYEVRVKGAAANAGGISMMPPAQASSNAFVSNFTIAGSNDTTAPTIYPLIADGSTGVAVNSKFDFGASEQMALSTLTSTNITLARGASSASATIKYDPASNNITVVPDSVLAPNTSYTITLGTGVTDLSGNGLTTAKTYTYTTGDADTTAPKIKGVRCDDYTCTISFTEPMNHAAQVDSSYASSVLNTANLTISGVASFTGKTLSYDVMSDSLKISGLALTIGQNATVTVGIGAKDLSGNTISTSGTPAGNARVTKIEDSKATFGNFGDMGMFGPPKNIVGAAGFEGQSTAAFKPEFGQFTAAQFAFGQADTAFPFNQVAGQDVNVFQTRFNPGVALQNADQVVFTFPTGTGIANATQDTYSPLNGDMNESGSGTVTFADSSPISVDTAARQVTITLKVTGTPGANDHYAIDLRKITNPSVPKGPDTGGYTVGIQVLRAGSALANKTSMPYFIQQGGSRSITVNIYAGSQATPDNVAGDVFLHGGGPAGPMDKKITLAAGVISQIDGTAAANLAYTGLNDGCYFFGTDPNVTLGANDYFGQMSPEPLCVNSTTPSVTKNIVLTRATASSATAVTVKLTGIATFGGNDVDIFAGGPGRFVVKSLSALAAPDANGYTLQIPANGHWFVGVGPGMPKGASGKITKQLPGVPPQPVNIDMTGVGTADAAMKAGFNVPQGVSVNTSTKTITFTFASADKTITGQVTDGTTGLQNVNVFMHAQGFGAPAFGTTDASGNFSVAVSDYGSYEIGATMDGLPPAMYSIDVRPDGSDAGTDPDIFFKGKQITGSNPLILKLNKPSYSISGKVLDTSNNPIANAPVFGTDADGNFVPGSTDTTGNYTLFVSAGTWTVKAQLPPDNTNLCGDISKTVVITTESKSSQNLQPSTGTCYDLSGTISVGGTGLANVPVFIDEWDTVNSRPAAGGSFRPTSTNSAGAYSAKVAGSKTYRVGTFDATYGELNDTVTVAAANTTKDITVASTGTITFAFTGGTSSMNAFVEIKKADNKALRQGKPKNGLDTNLVLNAQAGTYDYFVDVFGVGRFTGQVATGSTATVNLGSTTLATLSGNVKDANTASGSNLSGVLVTATETTSGVTRTALTDASGNYSLSLKTGTYTVSASRAEYTPSATPVDVALSENTTYNFGGSGGQRALVKGSSVISGTVYASDGTTKMTDGFVTGTNAAGVTINSPIDPQAGTYSLPVTDGVWTIVAKGPRHARTTRSGTVTVAGADQTGKDITLTADATRVPAADSKVMAANVGGTLDDSDSSGVKLSAGQGALESGSGDVTVQVEKSYTAPDTTNFKPLGDTSFNITAKGSIPNIKDLAGTADIQIDYTSLLAKLPAGVSESNLKLVYYSPEKGDYVPVEGGFTIDTTANTMTTQTNHFTTFAIVYTPVAAAAPAAVAAAAAAGSVPPGSIASSTTTTQTTTQQTTTTTTPTVTTAKPISQMTKAELLAKIEEVKTAIQSLLAQLAALKGEVNANYTNVPKGYAFGKKIDVKGAKGVSDEVKYLQSVLKAEVPVAYGKDTPVTGFFGARTKAAVKAFQEKYAGEILAPFGLKSGTGTIGAKTLQKLNALLGK